VKNDNLTIRIIRGTFFPSAYKDFLLNQNMNRGKYRVILTVATLFLNCLNENVKRLGYRIIVIYCNRTNDYRPLYDITTNTGLLPISYFIEEQLIDEDDKNVFTELNAAYNKNFAVNSVICTLQQKKMIDFYRGNKNESLAVVAPTSYGKTELILHTINDSVDKNICIITPTKSLLAQTKMRILKACDRELKVITHPEMYNRNESNVLAVMTQERVLRLLKNNPLCTFDCVIIDEAHELLGPSDRSRLLTSVIVVLFKRNPKTVFKFLTPFIYDTTNLNVRYVENISKQYTVNEYVKTEMIYLVELRDNMPKKITFYDQFMNQFYDFGVCDTYNEFSFMLEHAGNKNIVYFNKPKDIEAFVEQIINKFKIIKSNKIRKACDNIAEYIHPEYRLIDSIKRGVIYHHGDVPEPIRLYIEKLYSEIKEIKYVITNSTLLEGINVPAEKMFVLDNKKGKGNLTPSAFKNLIGRVCRFSQIFDEEYGTLKRLEPEIYLVVGKYYSSHANVKNFITTAMNVEKKVEDKLENVLLKKTNITSDNKKELENAKEFIENYEDGAIPNYNLRKVKTDAGKICFLNNINEINIFEQEEYIENKFVEIKREIGLIDNTEKLFDVMYEMFLRKSDKEIMSRFRYEETRRFYKMFLDWRITNVSLNQMISSFMKYWKGLLSRNKDETIIFVGRWGDMTREGAKPLWTNISNKTDKELVNLAIVRIKEEQDFLDNVLIKYVEVLNDLGLIENRLYLFIKYGTDDKRAITCIKNGLNLTLAKILIEKYAEYIDVNIDDDTISLRDDIIEKMREAGENEVMICEMDMFCK
jgi:hypothetical protein